MSETNGLISYYDIRNIFIDALRQLRQMGHGDHFNERYLHHYFSREIQKYIPISFGQDCQLHPEWATAVKGTKRNAKYSWSSEGYKINDENGSPGFVDFAIGSIEHPYCGIEFKMSTKFDSYGVVYDLMKLLDNRNMFNEAISIVVYYGHIRKSKLMAPNVLDNLLETAKNKLGVSRLANDRRLHIIVAEISQLGSTLYEYPGLNNKFFPNNIDK